MLVISSTCVHFSYLETHFFAEYECFHSINNLDIAVEHSYEADCDKDGILRMSHFLDHEPPIINVGNRYFFIRNIVVLTTIIL